MTRTKPSALDLALVAAVGEAGFTISPTQLERWRTKLWLARAADWPDPDTGELRPEVVHRSACLADASRPGRSISWIGWIFWAIDDTPQTAARLRDAARRERRVGLVAVRDRLGERARGQRGPLTGPNPTDHGKLGSKIHVICDRNGLPLSVGISGANLHDSQALIPLMRGIPPIRSRYGPRRRRPAKLHADKGYDFDHLPQLATATTDSASHCPPRRRVVGSFGAAF